MNKQLSILCAISATSTLALALIVAMPKVNELRATTTQSYSCASVHFGMKDSDHTAMTYDPSTSSADMSGYYTANNISATISAEYCYHGGAYTAADTSYSQYAIRIGKSKTLGTLTLTFDKNIIGCTVYALQYASDPVVMKVNGTVQSLLHSAASKTKANAAPETYDAYTFTFAETNTLILTAKQASKTVSGKSVSASRYYIADISLRVAQ